MTLSGQRKEREWEQIIAGRKNAGVMFETGDEFECPECGDIVDFDDFMNGDEPYGCPSCGESLL